MALISLELAKKQVKADGSASQDDLIRLFADAAELNATEHLNRKVFADQVALDAAVVSGTAGDDPIVLNASIKTAILLTLTFLFNNRGDVDVPLPSAAITFLQPFRKKMGV